MVTDASTAAASFRFVIGAVAAEDPTITRWPRCSRSQSIGDGLRTKTSGPGSSNVRPWTAIDGPAPATHREGPQRPGAPPLATSHHLEGELVAALGASAVAGLRAGLLAIVSQSGALDDVLARRARLVW